MITLQIPLQVVCLLYDDFFFFLLFRAAPVAYGGSQARGWIWTMAAGVHDSHSNTGSEQCVWPTPQLMTMPDP